MLTKERLEELIEQSATIWRSMCGDIHKIRLDKRYFFCDDNKLCWHTIAKLMPRLFVDFDYLFETKEDAEEYAEFGNITRTEKLVFPRWEDVKDVGYDEIFFVKDNRFDSGVVQYYFLVAEQSKDIQIMFREIDHIMTINAYDVIFNKPLTRENYNEARRLCVKLFKGE